MLLTLIVIHNTFTKRICKVHNTVKTVADQNHHHVFSVNDSWFMHQEEVVVVQGIQLVVTSVQTHIVAIIICIYTCTYLCV